MPAVTKGSSICRAAPRTTLSREPPQEPVDLVYLCFPNNPTGAVASRAQLTRWVDYAREHEAIILFDAAYEAYISDPEIPHSIYEIPGARECAIEFRSFSKNGGFTGVRCGFTVMPKSLHARTADGRKLPLHPFWHRRWSTKANGVSYPVQRGAEAVYTAEGRSQVRTLIDHYMGNARILREAAARAGLDVYGGVNAPYIWVKTPARPDELADVRSDAAGIECRHHARQRFRFVRRRVFPHLGLQQPRERRGSGAPFADAGLGGSGAPADANGRLACRISDGARSTALAVEVDARKFCG